MKGEVDLKIEEIIDLAMQDTVPFNSDQKFFMLAISIFPVKQHFCMKSIYAGEAVLTISMLLAA